MSTNFNTTPYFDDYDENKNFLKILFRPGYAVQTRELNQLQTILQKQVDRFGQHAFKEGSMVIPGGISINTNFNYAKLSGDITSVVTIATVDQAATTLSNIETAAIAMVGNKVTGETSGVTGIVKYYQLANSESPLTLFVEYDSSGTDNATETFADNEVLSIRVSETDNDNYTSYKVNTAEVNATGLGSAAEISRGVFFVNGYFNLVEKQTIILDAYTNAPSYRVGLRINETIVTPEADTSLTDNANGSFNYAAPGAHRYKVQLVLEKLLLDSTNDETFIELLQTNEGTNELHVTKTEYSILGDELARRTYDESGDYTVTPFRMTAREARNNARGAWANTTIYQIGDIVTTDSGTYVATQSGTSGNIEPVHLIDDATDGGIIWTYEESPRYNNGHSLSGSEDQLIIAAEPGKAYVRGYEIEKPSTTFIAIDKARDNNQISNDLIPTTIGNYVFARNITGIPDFVTFDSVNLRSYDDSIIGTARIRGLEYAGANSYRLYLFNILLNDDVKFERDIKSIANAGFEAEIENITETDAQGSVTVSDVINTAGNSTIIGNGTRFTRDFIAGDVIDVSSNYYVVDSIISDTELEISGAGTNATNVAYKIHRTTLQNSSRAISIFPLARGFIKSVQNEVIPETPVYNMSYSVMQKVTKATTSGQTSLTISLAEVTGLTGIASRIDPNAETSEFLVAASGNSLVALTDGTLDRTSDPSDQSFIVTGLTQSTAYTFFFPAIKNEATTVTPKTKTLERYAFIDVNTSSLYEAKEISLAKADVTRIRKIYMKDDTTDFVTADEATASDITDHFNLDDGQRDTHYDVAKLVRKPNYGAPTGTLRIYFDYFQHSATGDYFSINSYQDIRREDIPLYSSIYGIIYLSDVLDFRPRINDAGTGFTGTGARLALPPKPGTTTQVDYTYYLPRVDKISMDIEGKFVVTSGTSNDNAAPPQTPDLTMHMATLTLTPYTLNPSYVNIDKIDNRRFTMRDIGKLQKRIENLEYYTSLSLLEQQASTLDITDELGLNRFKNGFIVDNFAGHTTGDVASIDYRCAIDMELKELRPSFTMDNVNLIEQARTNAERALQGYQLTGDLITLPYTESELISQKYASRPENVNPFAVFTFIGSIGLNPPSDEWIETKRAPEVINDVEGNYSSVLNAQRGSGALGTVWNSWQTQWTGTAVTGNTLVRVGDWSTNNVGLGAGSWQNRNTFTAAEVQLIGGTAGGRVLTYEVIANQTGQTRTGLNTEVRATFSKELVNDRMVSTSVVPFIRSRKVAFLARGLKLQTIVHPFFDDVNVSSYVTPAARLSYISSNNILFDYETNVGADNDETARRLGGNVQTSFNKGDVIYVSKRGTQVYASPITSPATAVCMLQEVQPGGTIRNVLVVNGPDAISTINQRFRAGDEIKGTVSGAIGIVESDFVPTRAGDQLVTNFGGDVAGIFDIPSNNALKFQTGNREFKLIDNLTNDDNTAKTRGFGNYRAEGVLQTWQSTYNSVRNAEVIRTTVTQDRTILTDERAGRIIRDSGWYDPLAQTFLIQNRGGAFITSVDVWFASIDPVKPITMQIREVVNGYPGKNILPFSTVTLYPYELRDENQPSGYGLSSNSITLSEAGIVSSAALQEISISVIDESSVPNATITNDWNTLRGKYAARPFWLLVPNTNTSTVYTPTTFQSDPNATGPLSVNRDAGNVGNLSDWFVICEMSKYPAGSIVSLSVDNSGSMKTSTVQASYNLFKQKCNDAGLVLVERNMPSENWVTPHNVDLIQFSSSTVAQQAATGSTSTWLAPDKPTKFKMKAPVYVQDIGEYCIVLLSNSNNYNVWTSELGGLDVTSATPRLISEQPYAGVLFKSQNASTWTAHQNEDLMFRVNVANFESSGSAMFVNSRLDNVELPENPFFTRINSSLVRVFQQNHGLVVGSKVTISGVATGVYNGIGAAQLNTTHEVIHIEQDAFVIRLTAIAGATGRTGGTGVTSSKNVMFNTLQPIIQSQNFSDTSLNFSVKTLSGASINGAETAGVLASTFVPVIANDSNTFASPRMVASPDNESLYSRGAKSFYLSASMSTNNSSVSPVIDTARTSLIAINNRINNATYTSNTADTIESDAFDYYEIVSASEVVGFSGSTITSSNDGIRTIFKSLRSGKYIAVTGASNAGNNGTHLITSIASDGSTITTASTFTTEAEGSAVTIKIYDNFINETALEGSADAKYLTRKVNFSNSAADSTNLTIRFAAEIPVGSVIDVYYKTSNSSSLTPFTELSWALAGTASSNSKLTDLVYNANGISEFNTAAVKLVMRSTNSSAVPIIKDLIITATA